MRILVVDDEPLFLEFIVENLRHMGFRDVTVAGSGEEALRTLAAATDPFDCFLLDIKMPGMDGIELCAKIREQAQYRLAPIIMITSVEAKTHMQDAFKAGATDYLEKPIEIITLQFRIQVAMMLVETVSGAVMTSPEPRSTLSVSPDCGALSQGTRVTFSDVSCMRDYYQLENRLLRLGEGSFPMTLLAIEMTDIHSLEQQVGRDEFLSVIYSASRILGAKLPSRATTLSYVGYGRFLGLVLVRNQIVPRLLQARLRDSLAAIASDHGVPGSVISALQVRPLSSRRMMSSEMALGLIREYARQLGSTQDMILPPISPTANRLFARLDAAK